MTEGNYTFETTPSIIKPDQFYCYNKKNGNISIGEIVGNSVISIATVLRINGKNISINYGFDKTHRSIAIERGSIRCFLYYQDFVKDYTEYLKAKAERRNKQPTRYIVDKSSFYCKKIRCLRIPYNQKVFNTKEEAEEYSEKGIVSLAKFIEEHLPLFKALNKEITDKKNEIENKFNDQICGRLSQFVTKPDRLKVDDLLLKVGSRKIDKSNIISYFEIIPDFSVRVIGFDETGNIAKLSNGMILISSECNEYSFPFLFDYTYRNKVEKVTCLTNIRNLATRIAYEITNLERIELYCKRYKPFVLRSATNVYVHRDNIELTYRVAEKMLKEIDQATEELYDRLRKEV